jgi:protein-tyrosine phosphatase
MNESPSQPIQENLWWVIPGQLAGVRKPLAEELDTLRVTGVGAIVSVMDDSENLDLYERAGIPYCWIPIKGGTAPTSGQLQELIDFVNAQIALSHAVAVHCTSGRRRTGTAIAAYLIAIGYSYKETLQTVMAANPAIELRETQVTFLKALAEKQNEVQS